MVNERQRSSFESLALRLDRPFGSDPKHFSNSAKCPFVSGRSFFVIRGTLLRPSYTQTVSVGAPFVKKITFVLVPGLYGLNVPLGSRSTVWSTQSCIRISNTSPA